MKRILLLSLLCIVAFASVAFAQSASQANLDSLNKTLTTVKGQTEALETSLQEMKPVLDALSKIKVSGYMQVQFQSTDNDGFAVSKWTTSGHDTSNSSAIPGKTVSGQYVGGAFPVGVHERFMVRRGRLKTV